ncbi:HD-GYP domain-containing protein [Candidatus Caldatribacterium sp. SIUC1]|uniref:HD-GYP domain-containing protein n=1 Tax=Candidatus Caldatribacterium sp. SIUC1 TaxID=3418365 RepID=UPI003F68E674
MALAFSVALGVSLLFLFLFLFSFSTTEAVTSIVTENAKNVREAVERVFHKYAQAFREFILSLRNNPANLEGKIAALSTLPEIEAVHYYFVSPKGTIYRTNYPGDLGLNLGAFPEFWNALNEELAKKGVALHPFALETRTGRIRMYLYTRLPEGDILELGFTLRPEILEPFVTGLLAFQRLPFVESVGLYSPHFHPVASAFPALPERLKNRIAAAPQKWAFGLFRRTTVRRLAVPLLSGASTALLVTVTFNFLHLVLFLGLLSLGGVGFLAYVKQHHRCFAALAEDLKTTMLYLEEEGEESFPALQFSETQAIASALRTFRKETEEAFATFSSKLAFIAEGHDPQTARHMQRVAEITRILVKELGLHNPDIVRYAGLHDIGKLFIPREILDKEGPLTDTEWEVVKLHTLLAGELLDHPRLAVARNIALYHHENFDGTGYPEGLRGEEIPFEAQILKIADVYDALRDERPYRRAFSHEEALRIITKGDGRVKPEHFHPRVLSAFLRRAEDIRRLYEE